MTVDSIMKKLSKKTLVVLIVILSTAIILMLVISFLNKQNQSPLNNAINAINSIISDVDGYTPDVQTEKPVVIIDAGHGGWEPGAGNGPINEKDIVLAISLEVEKILKKKKIDYYMIRTDDTYVSLEDRVQIANEKLGSLFVSIHNNSFTDSSQGGILTTYNPSSPTGKENAEIMQSKISDLGMKNRNVMPRQNLYVLRHTDMPSLLLEIGFISNSKDLKLITDTSFQQKCAQQIVFGIEAIISKAVTAEARSSVED